MIIFLVCFITFLSTLAGGLFALRFRDKLHLILGFSAGAVMGVVFFDLFPEAITLGSNIYSPQIIISFSALGFLIYLILDRLAVLSAKKKKNPSGLKGILGAGSLSIHSFFDGIAIGLAFQISSSIGIIIAIAVIAHDFSDGINTVSVLLLNKAKSYSTLKWLLADAIAPVIGVLTTFLFRLPESLFSLVLAVFAGFFMYIGASDLIPESQHQHPKLWTTFMTILGAAVLYVITKL